LRSWQSLKLSRNSLSCPFQGLIFHYRVQKDKAKVPVLCQLLSVHTLETCFYEATFISAKVFQIISLLQVFRYNFRINF